MKQLFHGFHFPKPNFKGPIFLSATILVLIFVVWGIVKGISIYQLVTAPREAPVVCTDAARAAKWPVTTTAVTQLKSEYGTLIKAQVSGEVTEICIKPGSYVKKDDLLLVIDSEAERAAAKLAKLTYERAKTLREQGVNSQSDLDSAEASFDSAQAALDKKEIRAPFDGKVGLNQVFVGQYVTPGTALISVESLKSLLADFALPQKDAAILNSAKSLSLTVDAYPDRVFDGKVSSVDPRVDEDTLTISGRGVFDNPNEELLNGMNGVVTINLGADKPVVVVPSIAIVYNAYGTFVYVVDDQKDAKTGKISHVVKQQFVKVGQTKGDYSAISEGLKAGDVVVSVGQMKLRNGIAVEIDNTQKPQMSENPTPEES